MREALDQGDFVLAAYVLTIVAAMALAVWSWAWMRRAERRKADLKRK
ncbi:hypothetical protein QQS45_13420 [Alteriqipengyuania flavescens]|nr:hypothetical protein [Alteriqipengyuania flavescens]WJY18591.1 hypothetical protein QQW98_13415 [Alteriqipengyuania flavescens]WJY24531.1 hypothetical protein QQS45_13420 [Alteriqipengyuania flavescens]